MSVVLLNQELKDVTNLDYGYLMKSNVTQLKDQLFKAKILFWHESQQYPSVELMPLKFNDKQGYDYPIGDLNLAKRVIMEDHGFISD